MSLLVFVLFIMLSAAVVTFGFEILELYHRMLWGLEKIPDYFKDGYQYLKPIGKIVIAVGIGIAVLTCSIRTLYLL